MNTPRDQDEEIEAAAAEWAVRRESGDFGPEDRRNLERWLAADPKHEEAHELALRTWERLRHLEIASDERALPSRRPVPRRLAAQRSPNLRENSRVAGQVRRFGTWRLVAAVLLIAVLPLGYLIAQDPLVMLMADHETGQGGSKTLSLPDGSTVVMNVQTALDVHFDADNRSIRLLRGEADFDVAPDPARPFVVSSGAMKVRALGTRFVVREVNVGSRVTVLEHRVQVSVKSRNAEGLVIGSGQSVTVLTDEKLSPVVEANPVQATAWQQGKLIFDRQPLADVLKEIDRYRGGRTVLMKGNIEEKSVSGVFKINNLDAAMDNIASEFDLEQIDIFPSVTILH